MIKISRDYLWVEHTKKHKNYFSIFAFFSHHKNANLDVLEAGSELWERANVYEIIFICKFSTISTTKALFIQHHYIFIHDLLRLWTSSFFHLPSLTKKLIIKFTSNGTEKYIYFGKNAIENHSTYVLSIHEDNELGVGNCLEIKIQ